MLHRCISTYIANPGHWVFRKPEVRYLFCFDSPVVSTFEQSENVAIAHTCRLLIQACSCLQWGDWPADRYRFDVHAICVCACMLVRLASQRLLSCLSVTLLWHLFIHWRKCHYRLFVALYGSKALITQLLTTSVFSKALVCRSSGSSHKLTDSIDNDQLRMLLAFCWVCWSGMYMYMWYFWICYPPWEN